MQDPALDNRFESELDGALRRAPEVPVPANFQQRLLARLPEQVPEPRGAGWELPAFAFGGVVSLTALGVVLFKTGVAHWLMRPEALLGVLALETALSFVWLWRVFRSVR
jgi:hypothetical protein